MSEPSGQVLTLDDPSEVLAIQRRLLQENQRLLAELTQANADLEARVEARTSELAESERRYRTIVEGTGDPVILTDATGIITAVNPAFTRVTGYAAEEVMGRRPGLLASGRHPPDFYRDLWRSLAETGAWRGTLWNRRKDGSVYVQNLAVTCVRDGRGDPCHYVGVYTDPQVESDTLERIWSDAQHDPLTGLPNRGLLQDRLESSLLRAGRDAKLLAVLFLDLNGFKPINDTYGHAVGDAVLQTLADRLRAVVRKTDTVARLGGDEFVILLPDLHSAAQGQRVEELVKWAVEAPVPTTSGDVTVGVSIGMAIYPQDGDDPVALLRLADARMYEDKGRDRT